MILYRIQNEIYNRPWLIKPSWHQSMVKSFEAYVENRKKAYKWNDDEDEDEDEASMDDIIENVKCLPEINTSDIALITIDGVIGKHLSPMEMECSNTIDIDRVANELNKVNNDDNISTIVLYINSPGGTVTGVKELGELINNISKSKTIIAYTDTVCASAAYWFASQCNAFYCSPSSDVGSIGVYSLLCDESKAMDMAGIKINAIVSKNAPLKLAGASFKALTDEERSLFQMDVDNIETEFFNAVKLNRDIDPASLKGWCYTGQQAVEKGLADGLINNLNDLITMLHQDTKNI